MVELNLKNIDKKNPLYRFYEEVINQGKLEVLDELYSKDYVNEIAPFGINKGIEGLKKFISDQKHAFPDWHININYWINDGDKHIVKWTVEGTHLGDFLGIKPTRKKIKKSGIDVETIVNNKIVKHDGAEDMLSLLQQIGAVDNFNPNFAVGSKI